MDHKDILSLLRPIKESYSKKWDVGQSNESYTELI